MRCLVCLLACANAFAFSVSGMTEPIAQAVISAGVSGRVQSIDVSEGTFVKKGSVLLTLEKDEQAWTLQMAKLVLESKSDLESAKQKKETFEKDYTATKNLFEQSSSVSAEQLWEKELQFKVALAEWQKLEMIEKKEEIEYNLARVEYDKRIIRAPFDGVVVKIHRNLAEGVQALEPLVDFVDVRQCRIITYIDASRTQGLKVGQSVSLQLGGAGKTRTRKGRIEFVSPVVDRSSMLRTVKAVFDNSDGTIEPGVTGKMVIGQ